MNEEIGVDIEVDSEQQEIPTEVKSDVLKGDKGDKGEKGDPTATIEINQVITGEPGTSVIIENVGTDVNMKLDITIPRGYKGDTPLKGIDYYTEVDKQELINEILSQVNQFSVEVVSELPTEEIKETTIYFVPKENSKQKDVYDEYIYINNDWEHIGTTEIDLSNYYNKVEVDSKVQEVNNAVQGINNKIDNLSKNYTGTNITASTCEGFGKIRKIYGYSTQKTRDGKNKFSLSYIRSSSVFEVTETGVNLKNCWTADIYTHDDLLKVMKPSTTYTMRSKVKVISRPSTMISHQYATMLLYRPGSSSLGSVVAPVLQMEDKETIALNTEKEYITTFTTPEDLSEVKILSYTFYGNNDGSTTGSAQGEIDLTEVMLVEGTYTAETFPEYEPYGVSPSPDYPSKIKNVADNINVFDLNKYKGIDCVLNGAATVTDTEITIKASSNNSTYTTIGLENTGSVIAEAYRQYCMEIPEGANKLIVNFKNNNTVRLASIYYNVLDENYTVLSGIPRIYNSTDEEGILQADINVNNAKYVLVRFDTTAGGDVTYKNIALGNLDKYSPYGEGTVKITSTDGTNTSNKVITCKPLCCLKDSEGSIIAQDYIDFTKGKIHRQCGYAIFNGTEEWIKHNYTYDGFTRFQIAKSEVKIWGKSLCSHFRANNGTPAKNVCTISQADSLILLCIDNNIATTVEELNTWLAQQKANGTPVILEYELAEEVIEPYADYTSMLITQYDNITNISNSDNAEMEVELTKNKAISSINENIGNLQEKYNDLNDRINEVNTNLNDKITNLTTYSTEEVKTGETWIDGKPIYKKTFSLNNRLLTPSNPINHNISNLGTVVSVQGIFKDADTFITFPYLYDTGNAMYLKVTSTQIITAVPKDGSLSLTASSNRTFYCTIEYTKTTD